MPSSSILNTIAQKAKAHHESVNAAYATYYGSVTTSPTTSPAQSTTTSPRASMDAEAAPKTRRSSSLLDTVAQKIKAHHESVNAAYATYYAPGTASPSQSPTTSPRASLDAEAPAPTENVESEPRRASLLWQKVKKAAKEHHQSVEAAVGTYYGAH